MPIIEQYVAPVFNEFSFNQLHEKTGYSIHYLYDIAVGRAPLRPRFRTFVAAVLQRPEAELFATAKQTRDAEEAALGRQAAYDDAVEHGE